MLLKHEITSAIIVALFVFMVTIANSQATGRPLTPSMYTVDEGSIEGYLGMDVIQTKSTYSKETMHMQTGIVPMTDIRFSASLLQPTLQELSNNTIGDCAIGVWHSFGLLWNTVASGMLIELGLPTAPDAYYNEKTFPTESGFTTFSLHFVAAYNKHSITLLFSGCYTFIPEPGESIFEGLSFNVTRSSTWSSLFGLNPLKKDSMLYYKKLSDDIGSFSITFIYEIYPMMPYVSFCVGDRINNSPVYGEHGLPVLYKGYNDTLFLVTSLGVRYFFSEKTYIGTGLVYNVLRNYDYSLRYAIGIEASSVW
ncbi:MAG: hypothetical protein WHV26_13360 [Spirochaetota bacterium]|jgi:hypothetical protein